MVEVRVRGLAVDAGTRQPVVILTDLSETRFLPIWIGVFEADAILLALENIKVPRPTTHDLMKTIVQEMGGRLERVVIHHMEENTYFAKLQVKRDGAEEKIEIDARPSDSIALALRLDAPIFVAEHILSQASIKDKNKVQKDMDDFRDFLKNVKPSDFAAYDLHKEEHPPAGEWKGPGTNPEEEPPEPDFGGDEEDEGGGEKGGPQG